MFPETGAVNSEAQQRSDPPGMVPFEVVSPIVVPLAPGNDPARIATDGLT
jgi:hypothetical protein